MDFLQEFQKIRDDRMGVVNSSVYPGLKILVSQIYPDEAHFIYELLQNAEDAQATEVEFLIKKSELIFSHNGSRMFDAEDVESITNIARSTKTDNYVQAGKFGIGFKSVYAFTETPYIYCDSINFKIEKLLLPTAVPPLENKRNGWTEFHFPFDSPKISPEDAKRKIKQGLLEIENTTLLFLNNIVSISYQLEDGTKTWVKKTVEGNMITSSVIYKGIPKARSTWKRFTRQTTLHKKRISVDIAFPMEKENGSDYRFVSGQDKVCITFLAKNEKSNLRFYINAPFGCTPARDTINKSDPDNIQLIHELATLTSQSLEILKQENLLTDSFFNILPLSDDGVPAFYLPIVIALKNSFANNNYLPTMNKNYVTVGNGIMSSRGVIDKTFTIKDIQFLYKNNHLQFVRNRAVNSRAYKYLKQLNIQELTPLSVLTHMIDCGEDSLNEWIVKIPIRQLIEIYAFLNTGILDLTKEYEKYERYKNYDYVSYSRSSIYQEEYQYAQIYKRAKKRLEKIRALKIARAEDGTFHKAPDVRILLKDITVPSEYILVDKKISENIDALRFLKNIGVKEFSEKELEKYFRDQETKKFVFELEHISTSDDPVKVAKRILSFIKCHTEGEINFSKYAFIHAQKTSNGSNTVVLSKPQNCYLDVPFIEETGFRFVENIHNKLALSTSYLQLDKKELAAWIELLKKYGCYYQLDVQSLSYKTGYTSGYHNDYSVEHLGNYLAMKNIALNRFIWNTFTAQNGWQYCYGQETYKRNRNYSARTSISSMLNELKNNAWILNRNGSLCFPEKVSELTIADDWPIREDNGFLTAIGFGEEQRKINAENKKREELELLQQKSTQEAAEKLGFASAEDVIAAKETLKMVEELTSYGVDLPDLLKSKRKERETKRFSLEEQLQMKQQNEFYAAEMPDDGEVYRIPNPERRASKIEAEIEEEGPPETKQVLTNRTTVNKEEKQFVGTEYSGHCQICNKVIYKKDGTRHFSAINLLDTGRLKQEYLQGLSTGWNTLCFCPNCAAEYRYGAVSLFDFADKVKTLTIDSSYNEYYEFEIELQGEKRKLRYTPRHLLSLKSALQFFDKQKEEPVTDNVSNSIGQAKEQAKEQVKQLSDENSKSPTLRNNIKSPSEKIVVVKHGECCPYCGRSNAHAKTQKVSVVDVKGKSQDIFARVCSCGKIFLTRKLWRLLPSTVEYKEIEGVPPAKGADTVCPICKKANPLFGGKGMCWECYKEKMNSMFDN